MKTILILIPLVCLSACSTKRLVQMPHSVPGTSLTPDDLESVRYSENLKTYPVGRYIDPNDDLVMHEAHTIYRVETTTKWNLHPNVSVRLPGGPVLGIVDPARSEPPVTAEVVAEVQKQKAATQALIDQGARINQALAQLSQSASGAKQLETSRLREEISLTRKRLEALEEQFRKQPPISVAPAPKGTNDW
jgi:hypothetical protein